MEHTDKHEVWREERVIPDVCHNLVVPFVNISLVGNNNCISPQFLKNLVSLVIVDLVIEACIEFQATLHTLV